MKRISAAFFLVLFMLDANATSLYDQLCTFNFNWKKYALVAPKSGSRIFNSDREYIQAHQYYVLGILRSAPTKQLSQAQLQNRRQMIAWLAEYREAGNFPLNHYRHERIPVFIDEHGTHCAVGYLMMKSGHDDLARRIAYADNYAWVKDIHESGVGEWQQESGLSLEELKLIQGAYDFFLPNALILPNKYEIPQKPVCGTTYFSNDKKTKANTWLYGEGTNGVLNGRWEQQFSAGIPWIIGYYENGERTGDWEEYYQGTKQLCRTEQWKNNKLNGIRKRFDREGNLIEEILFADGEAVCKTNYEGNDSLAYVRIPLDSAHVWTQVYNADGQLIACGKEKIFNPGGLMWFQNIELTALNSAAITARSVQLAAISSPTMPLEINNDGAVLVFPGRQQLYNNTPLVQYMKEGDWWYYREKDSAYAGYSEENLRFAEEYAHFGKEIIGSLGMVDGKYFRQDFDSIRIRYENNLVHGFSGYKSSKQLLFEYYDRKTVAGYRLTSPGGYGTRDMLIVKAAGWLNSSGEKTDSWDYYTLNGVLWKSESFVLPEEQKIIPALTASAR